MGPEPLWSHLKRVLGRFEVTVHGFACTGVGAVAGSYYQDSPVNPSMGGSGATSLSLTVLIVTTHPSFSHMPCPSVRIHSTIVTHGAEGVWSLFQDRTRQEVEFAPPWMGSRHVLKQGPHHLGGHAESKTVCKIDKRRSCASLRPRHTVHPEHNTALAFRMKSLFCLPC